MPSLTKCFAFCVRYQPEMTRYFWKKDQTEKNGVPDDSLEPEILRMVQEVGNKCRDEVREFLTSCGNVIREHFDEIGRCAPAKRSDTNWHVRSAVSLESGTRWKMEAGVNISRTNQEVIPWMWGEGRSRAETKMEEEFGNAVIKSSNVDLQAGTVALSRIPLMIGSDFEIDADRLLKEVKHAFVTVTKSKFENVYNYVKNL